MLTQPPNHELQSRLLQDDKAVALMFLHTDTRLHLVQLQHQTACPSPETLAAYIDRQLSKADRQRIQTHLQTCSNCNFHYQEVCAVLPWHQKAWSYAHEKVREAMTMIHYGLAWVIKTFSGPLLVPAAVTAFMAVLLVSGVIFYRSLTTLSPLEESYQMAFQQPQVVAQKSGTSPLGFMKSTKSLAAQAFKAGLQVGQQRLLEKRLDVEQVAYDSAFTTHYELGQWVALLQVTAPNVTVMPEPFWSQQYAIGENLTQRLGTDAQANETALTGLKPIMAVLANLQQQPSQQLGYELQQPLNTLMLRQSIE